jgi:dihydroflavonol-4-reductase
LLAETHGRLGERYIIANEFVGTRDFYAMAMAGTDKPMPRIIPSRVAYAVAWVAERVMKLLGRNDYMISTSAVYLSTVFRELDNGKARGELGWSPRPLGETVRDAVDWFQEKEAADVASTPPIC